MTPCQEAPGVFWTPLGTGSCIRPHQGAQEEEEMLASEPPRTGTGPREEDFLSREPTSSGRWDSTHPSSGPSPRGLPGPGRCKWTVVMFWSLGACSGNPGSGKKLVEGVRGKGRVDTAKGVWLQSNPFPLRCCLQS